MTVIKVARSIMNPRRRESHPLLEDARPDSHAQNDEQMGPPAYTDIYPMPSRAPTLPTSPLLQQNLNDSVEHLNCTRHSSTPSSIHSTPSSKTNSHAKRPSIARLLMNSFLSWVVVTPSEHDGNPGFSCGVTGDCMVSGE
jgi:hypothetical protein